MSPVASPIPHPASPIPLSVHRTVLPNGLTVLIQQDRSAPVVAIVTYVKAGYFDETDEQNGLAHALEHMFFKGTSKRGVGDIAKETKASGGYLNAHTIYDNTTYYTVLPSSSFAKGLEIQADAYANSVIDGRELAKEMEVIIQEAKRKSDSPSAVATETLYELLHDAHRMRRWRIGREPGLRSFTRDLMNGFYKNFYRPSNTILSISGDVDPGDALRQVTEIYGGLNGGESRRQPGPPEPDHTVSVTASSPATSRRRNFSLAGALRALYTQIPRRSMSPQHCSALAARLDYIAPYAKRSLLHR
jgi:zinc protease